MIVFGVFIWAIFTGHPWISVLLLAHLAFSLFVALQESGRL